MDSFLEYIPAKGYIVHVMPYQIVALLILLYSGLKLLVNK